MSDEMERNSWFARIVTIPNILALGAMVIGGSMTYQAQIGKLDQVETHVQQNDARIDRLEKRLDEERATNNAIFMRSDVLSAQLQSIRDEQVRIREQLQAINRGLR